MPPYTLQPLSPAEQLVNLFDNGLAIYNSYANRITAIKLTAAETELKLKETLAKIDAPTPAPTPLILGINRNYFIAGSIGVLLIGLLIYRSK